MGEPQRPGRAEPDQATQATQATQGAGPKAEAESPPWHPRATRAARFAQGWATLRWLRAAAAVEGAALEWAGAPAGAGAARRRRRAALEAEMVALLEAAGVLRRITPARRPRRAAPPKD